MMTTGHSTLVSTHHLLALVRTSRIAFCASIQNGFRWADRNAISQAIPYPIASFYLVLIGGKVPANVPPRIEVPPLDEGPHQSYAIQWFSFATIAIVGMILYVRRK